MTPRSTFFRDKRLDGSGTVWTRTVGGGVCRASRTEFRVGRVPQEAEWSKGSGVGGWRTTGRGRKEDEPRVSTYGRNVSVGVVRDMRSETDRLGK